MFELSSIFEAFIFSKSSSANGSITNNSSCCRVGASLCCGEGDSDCGGYSDCGAQALGTQASVVAAHGLSSCIVWIWAKGSKAVAHKLCCCMACGILPD